MSKGIVKSSEIIRTSLQKRIKELNLSLTAISLDAKKRNYKISIHSLSRFFGQSDKNNLSEDNIIWLCYRYGIFVTLHVGSVKYENNKIIMKIPPYNEGKCLNILNILFKNETTKDAKLPKRKRIHLVGERSSIRKSEANKDI